MDDCGREMRLIKIIDDKIATRLARGGFSYMKETMNNKQEVYIFAATESLMQEINKCMEFCSDGIKDVLWIEDCSLCF